VKELKLSSPQLIANPASSTAEPVPPAECVAAPRPAETPADPLQKPNTPGHPSPDGTDAAQWNEQRKTIVQLHEQERQQKGLDGWDGHKEQERLAAEAKAKRLAEIERQRLEKEEKERLAKEAAMAKLRVGDDAIKAQEDEKARFLERLAKSKADRDAAAAAEAAKANEEAARLAAIAAEKAAAEKAAKSDAGKKFLDAEAEAAERRRLRKLKRSKFEQAEALKKGEADKHVTDALVEKRGEFKLTNELRKTEAPDFTKINQNPVQPKAKKEKKEKKKKKGFALPTTGAVKKTGEWGAG